MERIKTHCLFIMAVAHILISFFTIIPGHLSIDEVTYHMMAKSFSQSGSLEIWNGYHEYPSPELESAFIFARNDRLVAQYPYLYPILSKPFYRIWGYRGLFFMNAIAYLGTAALCYVIAKKLFNDRNLALNACFIFVLATFSWEYSQAAWPHATGTLFLMSAFYFFTCSLYSKTETTAFYSAFLSGLITGFAVGIRLDSIFALPCLIIPFFFMKPWRPWCALGVCVGALPGLLVLNATNYVKFGVFSFLSYGRSIESSLGLSEIKQYFPFAVVVAVLVAILWLLTKDSIRKTLIRYKRRSIIGAVFLAVVLTMIPQVRQTIERPLSGAYQLIIDLRVRDLDIKEPGLSRSSGGGMVYMEGLKKSLLQSCPYLVVLLLPLVKIVRFDRDAGKLTILFFIPIVFIGFYSYRNGWHGGLCLNLRYFIPILPFTSILTAYTWRELAGKLNLQWRRISTVTIIIFIILYIAILLYMTTKNINFNQHEFPVLTLPLLLGFLLTVFLIISNIFTRFKAHIVARTTLTLFFTAMVWSFFVAILYDFPRAYGLRDYYLKIANTASDLDFKDSIIFTNNYNAFSGLIEKGQIRIACPVKDNFHDFPELTAFHLQKGHSVYTAFTHSTWNKIQKNGLLDPFKVVPIKFKENYFISKLTVKTSL